MTSQRYPVADGSPSICDDRWAGPATYDTLELEALVATTSLGERTPRLTVEQRAIAVFCLDLRSIAEIAARLHLPLASPAFWWATWPTSIWSSSTGPPRPATGPTWPCWSGCRTGCAPSEGCLPPLRRRSATPRQRPMADSLPVGLHPGRTGIRRDLRDLEPYRRSRSSSRETAAWSGTRSRVWVTTARVGSGQGAQQRIAQPAGHSRLVATPLAAARRPRHPVAAVGNRCPRSAGEPAHGGRGRLGRPEAARLTELSGCTIRGAC